MCHNKARKSEATQKWGKDKYEMNIENKDILDKKALIRHKVPR